MSMRENREVSERIDGMWKALSAHAWKVVSDTDLQVFAQVFGNCCTPEDVEAVCAEYVEVEL